MSRAIYWLKAQQCGQRVQRRYTECAHQRLADRDTAGVVCCVACGEADPATLTIDHIAGDGAQDGPRHDRSRRLRRDLARGVRSTDGLRLLCHSCQWRAIRYGPDPAQWPAECWRPRAGRAKLKERQNEYLCPVSLGSVATVDGLYTRLQWARLQAATAACEAYRARDTRTLACAQAYTQEFVRPMRHAHEGG